MTAEELQLKVLQVVSEQVAREPASIPLNTPFEELGLDSVDAMTIMFALEDEFRISIPDEEARAVTTVNHLITVVAESMKQK